MLSIGLGRKIEEITSPIEKRMVSVQHTTLTKRLQTVMENYQTALAHHQAQTEAHIKKQLRIGIYLANINLNTNLNLFYIGTSKFVL